MVNKIIEDILQRAIKFEEDSYNLYTSASRMVESEHTRAWLDELAGYELEHKAKLQGLLAGELEWELEKSKAEKIADLQIGDYLVAAPLDERSTFQDVLLVAIKREQAAHDFYASMSDLVTESQVKSLFELLAQEELKHKRKVESYYEEMVYQDF